MHWTRRPDPAHNPQIVGTELSTPRDRMRRSSHDLLQRTLRTLDSGGFPLDVDWDLLVRQARRAGLLARLAIELERQGLLEEVPPQPRLHLEGERALAEKHVRDVRWEIRQIKAALAPLGVPLIFLKGAAYVLADLPPARGRLFGDIDVMVPEDCLEAVEAALKIAGWHFAKLDGYDEKYYRRWTHQLPPMTHSFRGTAIDVHHTIVARTTRLHLNAKKLFAAAVPAPNDPELNTLAPTDMVLHSAAHLLNEGEFERGLRDLHDLNLLLRHFGRDTAFWAALVARAAELDLRRPLYYALRYTDRLCGTPVPNAVRDARDLQPPALPLRALMDALFGRGLRPQHWSCRDSWSRVALLLLFVRAHYLLMPPHLLIPHLVRKSLKELRHRP